jgi:hypothetical protein
MLDDPFVPSDYAKIGKYSTKTKEKLPNGKCTKSADVFRRSKYESNFRNR